MDMRWYVVVGIDEYQEETQWVHVYLHDAIEHVNELGDEGWDAQVFEARVTAIGESLFSRNPIFR